ncbi:hypothetical protein [Parapedobacter tibetensis]|uniref:hypothetical protein n=1 Tax=Parapedobacter tibetensis TaxID=2972951 RepID=UPI00214D6FC9|nr:hypothetical protein [Parapedobacter tibetensis]
MGVTTLKDLAKKGSDAVRRLRIQRLENGFPFMINARELEGSMCYLEYPDGTINLVKQSANGMDFEVIHTLDQREANDFRNKYQLR